MYQKLCHEHIYTQADNEASNKVNVKKPVAQAQIMDS